MESLFQLAASIGGISGLLALVILAMYRWDRKASEDRLTGLIEADQETRQANTVALTELTTLLVRLNGK